MVASHINARYVRQRQHTRDDGQDGATGAQGPAGGDGADADLIADPRDIESSLLTADDGLQGQLAAASLGKLPCCAVIGNHR